jgi:hypothetical protein
MRLPEGGEVRVLRGSTEPMAGWISRSFDKKHPAPTVAWRRTVTGTARLRTEISV